MHSVSRSMCIDIVEGIIQCNRRYGLKAHTYKVLSWYLVRKLYSDWECQAHNRNYTVLATRTTALRRALEYMAHKGTLCMFRRPKPRTVWHIDVAAKYRHWYLADRSQLMVEVPRTLTESHI